MKKKLKNGIQCTTQYKFLNSIVPCVDFVVLCCLVGPLKVCTNPPQKLFKWKLPLVNLPMAKCSASAKCEKLQLR